MDENAVAGQKISFGKEEHKMGKRIETKRRQAPLEARRKEWEEEREAGRGHGMGQGERGEGDGRG